MAASTSGAPSSFLGVVPTGDGRWAVEFVARGQLIEAGSFETDTAAARAYDRVAVELWRIAGGGLGLEPDLNFPGAEPPSPAEGGGDAPLALNAQRLRRRCEKIVRKEERNAELRSKRKRQDYMPSRYIGVSGTHGKWRAVCKRHELGHFGDEAAAARAYDACAVRLGLNRPAAPGAKARLNFPAEHRVGAGADGGGGEDGGSDGADGRDGGGDASGGDGGDGEACAYRGVARDSGRMWKACLYHAGRNYFLGRYATAEAAARAYDLKALELQGAKARLNFPPEVFVYKGK